MTTLCYGFGNGRFGHPDQARALSLREAAILQSFPRNYVFMEPERITFKAVGRMIGNAVPVRLGEVIGESLMQHIRAYEAIRREEDRIQA
jgi:DNA (cytosine-5)-methyltransferase 1